MTNKRRPIHPGEQLREELEALGRDITFTAFLSPKGSGKLLWGAGPVLLLPTATDNVLGADKWGLGPSVILLKMPGQWVIGSLFSQVWSVGGEGGSEVSFFTWQYFINYNLANGVYLTTAPIITANWNAGSSGDTWTVPFGGGVGKIFKIGEQAMNTKVESYYNVERPDGAPKWTIGFTVQFLFPK